MGLKAKLIMLGIAGILAAGSGHIHSKTPTRKNPQPHYVFQKLNGNRLPNYDLVIYADEDWNNDPDFIALKKNRDANGSYRIWGLPKNNRWH